MSLLPRRRLLVPFLIAAVSVGLATCTKSPAASPAAPATITHSLSLAAWDDLPPPSLVEKVPDEWNIDLTKTRLAQTFEGFGAAFSEIGYQALSTLPQPKQDEVLEKLFNSTTGAGLSFCRVPIGCSDFALEYYSHDDFPGDYSMDKFSIARDEKYLIPFIQAAQKHAPHLRLHAAPWTPPKWLKTSGLYDLGTLKDDDRSLRAYALYLARFVEEYDRRGIPIERLFPQNEPDMSSIFPNCPLASDLYVRFVVDYLAPNFKQRQVKAQIWAGTFRTIAARQASEVMANDKFRNAIAGLGFQYADAAHVQEIALRYSKPVMHTEAACYTAENNGPEALALLRDIISQLHAGVTVYSYWNMILNETAMSSWLWPQNSLVTINRKNAKITYQHDYQIITLLGQSLRPGDRLLTTPSLDDPYIAARQADGTTLLIIPNITAQPHTLKIQLPNKTATLQVLPTTIATITIPP